MLKRLNDSGLGCHVSHLSYAGSGYADDVGVVSPSVRALQQMLDICELFAGEYKVMFNAKKTICMRVGNSGPQARGQTVWCTDSVERPG